MEYLQPKDLNEAPKYYKNPAGVGAFSNLRNTVRHRRQDLILTTEYVENNNPAVGQFFGTTFTFKLQYKYTYETIQTLISYFIRGIYIKGLVDFEDNTQIGFNTTASVSIDGQELSITVQTPYGKRAKRARLRISQIQY